MSLLGLSNEQECGGWGMWHEWERREVHIGFWWEPLNERDHLDDQGVDERIIIKRIFN